jgi:hypothetical protein
VDGDVSDGRVIGLLPVSGDFVGGLIVLEGRVRESWVAAKFVLVGEVKLFRVVCLGSVDVDPGVEGVLAVVVTVEANVNGMTLASEFEELLAGRRVEGAVPVVAWGGPVGGEDSTDDGGNVVVRELAGDFCEGETFDGADSFLVGASTVDGVVGSVDGMTTGTFGLGECRRSWAIRLGRIAWEFSHTHVWGGSPFRVTALGVLQG